VKMSSRWLIVAGLLLPMALENRAAECPTPGPETPRVVIVSLDGVAIRTLPKARKRGAFADWPPARPLVSTFPSMTNVAFTAILRPFGMGTIGGYEMKYFDHERNSVVGGGPVGYEGRSYAWRDFYQVMEHSNWKKRGEYFYPRKAIAAKLEWVADEVMRSEREVILAHFGTTDVVAHFAGDEPIVEALETVSASLKALAARHLAERGRPLIFVLLSDHGNTEHRVRFERGIHELLRDAGLRVRESLEQPGDVASASYGVVSFGVLFTDDAHAEVAARAVIAHEGVNLAVWRVGPFELGVVGDEGEARILWSGGPGNRRIAYSPVEGDLLRLASVVEELRSDGELDPRGYASEDAWFARSALADYPDAPRRLIDSLDGTYVSNAASVIMSFKEGYTWGTYAARLGAHMFGGLAGTHGSLDRTSTLGFFLTNDPTYPDGAAVRADRVLAHWAAQHACTAGESSP